MHGNTGMRKIRESELESLKEKAAKFEDMFKTFDEIIEELEEKRDKIEELQTEIENLIMRS